ncbi:LacI family DNA-binding transcriptional regulator [Chiayiivirga flava]|uniref:LacI family transcriptional regulator n=1 Tax=Chiayiivirga flava TaxID=659595 RepID=A0A7W8G0I9_9GAMM|nr:LacI family DNA-binding transcriptional regulator [Chiayiivirga flava]MBB5209542.1 LacI family transcriptional regulator [Chiayiivirga flava]
MSVTIKDVAKAARVSVASVSRAMNNHESVSDAVRERVTAAARELHYVPHSAARSLITRRTQTIGVLLPDLHGEFFSELIRGIDQAARRAGMHMLVSSSHGDSEEAVAAIRTMRGRVDGLLLMSPHIDAGVLHEHLPAALPVVLMNTPLDTGDYDAITIDNYWGAHAMVRHLVQRGHRRIALIAGPDRNFDAQERLRGYREALAELLPDTREQVVAGDFSEEAGYRAGQLLLAQHALPDAIFAANDMMAIGCLFALNEAGVVVPRDVALAGFDDIPIARFVSPPLTTVRVRIADLGQQAFERLMAALQPDDAHRTAPQTLRAELVVRQSCDRTTASTNTTEALDARP